MALAAYATEYGSITMLNTHQFDLVRKIIATLEPVEEITKMISTDAAAASVLIPLLRTLEKSLTKHHNDSGIQTMKGEMLSSLKQRFEDVEKHEELIIATILDPRYKDKFFATAATKEFAKQRIIDMCDEVNEPPNKRQCTDDGTSACSSKVWECMSEILEDLGECSDDSVGTSGMELNSYLREPLICFQKGNPYVWWNENQQRYPLLARIARRYLSAPPTSMPLERLFSGAGNIYDDHRSRLTAEKAEMLLSIKYNLKIVGYKY